MYALMDTGHNVMIGFNVYTDGDISLCQFQDNVWVTHNRSTAEHVLAQIENGYGVGCFDSPYVADVRHCDLAIVKLDVQSREFDHD